MSSFVQLIVSHFHLLKGNNLLLQGISTKRRVWMKIKSCWWWWISFTSDQPRWSVIGIAIASSVQWYNIDNHGISIGSKISEWTWERNANSWKHSPVKKRRKEMKCWKMIQHTEWDFCEDLKKVVFHLMLWLKATWTRMWALSSIEKFLCELPQKLNLKYYHIMWAKSGRSRRRSCVSIHEFQCSFLVSRLFFRVVERVDMVKWSEFRKFLWTSL